MRKIDQEVFNVIQKNIEQIKNWLYHYNDTNVLNGRMKDFSEECCYEISDFFHACLHTVEYFFNLYGRPINKNDWELIKKFDSFSWEDNIDVKVIENDETLLYFGNVKSFNSYVNMISGILSK
jgi:hypothetical protein